MDKVQEDSSHTMTVTNTTGVSTSGMTVYVYLSQNDTTPVSIGSGQGAAAGSNITIACDFSLVTPGVYELEVVADPTSANPVTLIPSTATEDPVYIKVASRKSFS